MSILRLSIVALTIVLFTMGALILPVNTALAHCKGKHLTDPGPPDCNDPHGGGDPEPTTAFSVDVDFGTNDGGAVVVTEIKMNGNRQGLNGTMESANLDKLGVLPCGITLSEDTLAQFSISTAKIPPRELILTYVEANIYDFTVRTDSGDANFSLSFVPNPPSTLTALFPTEKGASNVLTGDDIGVSASPDHESCSATIRQDWTITVTKN